MIFRRFSSMHCLYLRLIISFLYTEIYGEIHIFLVSLFLDQFQVSFLLWKNTKMIFIHVFCSARSSVTDIFLSAQKKINEETDITFDSLSNSRKYFSD